ncbi:cytochrome P450 6B7-like [Vanessa cardui]|uniref:cytochrome P450 6B7-like n=1 Tax=Vanessa cardui TaxID=171605 RepID=UPI001F12F873|nr:cytochrome P450 6B7-like [Vanessa cardui]
MLAVIITVTVLLVLYLYGTRNFKYWERRQVKHEKPVLFFGNNTRNYFMQKSVSEMAEELYWKYPSEKVVGFYRASRPELVIRDPEITKRILTTDFANFYARGLNKNTVEMEPLLRNLFFADGDLWRLLRQRMTSAFTSSKLKAMFPLIVERAERLQMWAHNATSEGQEIDARELMARYTIDIIGACGFGLDSDSLKEENSTFQKLGNSIFKAGPKYFFIIILKELFPKIFNNLKVLTHVEKAIYRLVHDVLRQRNYEPSTRNDFIDILLKYKKKGTIVGDSIEKIKPDGTPEIVSLEMNDDLIAAQVFVFFAAGFETSSSATSFTLHELAHHIDIQNKIQQEIDSVLEKFDNKLCYDAIKEMRYLEWSFKEAMRIFPTGGYLMRKCSQKYTFEDLNLTIDKGVGITIPIKSMQNDSKYFDNPSEFRPERFDPNNFNDNNKYIYLPFGGGPRACIGERFALMQSIAGLVAILSRFSVRPAPSTVRHPEIEPTSAIVQTVKGGLPLLFLERKPREK